MKLPIGFLMLGSLFYLIFCGFQFQPSVIVPDASSKQSYQAGHFLPKLASDAPRMVVADEQPHSLDSILSLLASASFFARSA